MSTELLVIGAGGHARVVIEAIQEKSQDSLIILTDQDLAKEGKKVLGSISIKHLKNWAELPEQYHAAIGNNQARHQLSVLAQEQGKQPFTVVHPDAYVSPSVRLGGGSFVAAKAVISTEAKISVGCIINHGAIVDHDCRIGSFAHIAPNATLGGGVEVGSGCLIGASATILPMVKIGSDVVVGAGAVVICDIPDNQTVMGNPGRCVSPDE